MVGGDGRPQMVERLLDKAEREFAASNRRLSPAIYTADDGGKIVPYVRSPGTPLGMQLTIAHEKLAIYEYEQQRAALDELYEKNGPDVFVANYQVFQAPGGGDPRSVSVWTKGVRSYLPRTERLVLLVMGPGKGAKLKTSVEVPFEAIENRLTQVHDLHPARFETTGEVPGEQELRAMGGRA
jgi:hypothetical protein